MHFNETIEQLELKLSEQKKKFKESLHNLKYICSSFQGENVQLQKASKTALDESEASQAVVLELKEELRRVKEELQSFATD